MQGKRGALPPFLFCYHPGLASINLFLMRFLTVTGLASLLAWASAGSAQDLNQLSARVSTFWTLRLQANKPDALSFVEPQSRQRFLLLSDGGLLNFKILGFEFTEDSSHVEVVVKTRVQTSLGEFDRTIHEPWIWVEGDWHWKAPPPTAGLLSTAATGGVASSVALPLDFRMADNVINLGRHVQGEVVEGRLPFRANGNDVLLIRAPDDIPGLLVGNAVWTGADEGYLPFRWDTILISENVRKELVLEATFTDDRRAVAKVLLTAQIDGRVAFKQTPEIIDPAESGQVELQIANLWNAPIKIVSAYCPDPAYVIDPDFRETIQPGGVARLLIRYKPQIVFQGAAIEFGLSDVFPSSIVTVPLHVKLAPRAAPAPLTREDAERLRRDAPSRR